MRERDRLELQAKHLTQSDGIFGETCSIPLADLGLGSLEPLRFERFPFIRRPTRNAGCASAACDWRLYINDDWCRYMIGVGITVGQPIVTPLCIGWAIRPQRLDHPSPMANQLHGLRPFRYDQCSDGAPASVSPMSPMSSMSSMYHEYAQRTRCCVLLDRF